MANEVTKPDSQTQADLEIELKKMREAGKSAWEKQEDTWKENRAAYWQFKAEERDEQTPKKADWQANAHLPYVFQIVHSTLPQFVMALTEERDYVSGKPTAREDEEYTERAERMVNYRLKHDVKFAMLSHQLIQEMISGGNVFLKTAYEKKNRTRHYKKTVTSEGVELGTEWEKEDYLIEKPDCSIVLPDRIWPDPEADDSDLTKCRFLIERYEKSKYEIKRMVEDGEIWDVDLDEVESAAIDTFDTVHDTEYTEKQREYQLYDVWFVETKKGRKDQNGNDTYGQWTLATTVGDTLVRYEISPYIYEGPPFLMLRNLPKTGEFYGHADVELILQFQEILDRITNQDLDAAVLAMKPIIEVDTNFLAPEFDWQKWEIQPGQTIPTTGGPLFRPFHLPDLRHVAASRLQFFRQFGEQLTGGIEYMRGVNSRSETLGGMQMMMGAVKSMFAMKMLVTMVPLLESLASRLFIMDKQFMSKEKWIKIVGEEIEDNWFQVDPDQLRGEFDFEITPSIAKAAAALTTKDLVELGTMWAGSPDVNHTELKRRALERAGEPAIEKIIIGDNPDEHALDEIDSEHRDLKTNGHISAPIRTQRHDIHIPEHEEFLNNGELDEEQEIVLQAHLDVTIQLAQESMQRMQSAGAVPGQPPLPSERPTTSGPREITGPTERNTGHTPRRQAGGSSGVPGTTPMEVGPYPVTE